MAKVYRNLIMKGIKTIDDVPERYKEEVLKLLAIEGIDGYGKPLV